MRQTKKQATIYQKVMKLYITGSDKDKIRDVAHSIHALSNRHLVGGRKNRHVTLSCESSDSIKIFDGIIE